MNLPDLSKLSEAELARQLAVTKLESAGVGLALAATCLRVGNQPQTTEFLKQAIADLNAAQTIVYGAVCFGVTPAQDALT